MPLPHTGAAMSAEDQAPMASVTARAIVPVAAVHQVVLRTPIEGMLGSLLGQGLRSLLPDAAPVETRPASSIGASGERELNEEYGVGASGARTERGPLRAADRRGCGLRELGPCGAGGNPPRITGIARAGGRSPPAGLGRRSARRAASRPKRQPAASALTDLAHVAGEAGTTISVHRPASFASLARAAAAGRG